MLAAYLKQSTTRIIRVYRRSNNNQCVFCLTENPANICDSCFDALPRLNLCCPMCAEPNQHGLTCGACLSTPPAFEGVICPFLLQGPVTGLIHRAKRSSKVAGLECLIEPLIERLSSQDFHGVVALPYHWRKSFKRGHNPTSVIAHRVSQSLGIPVLKALVRHKSTKSQQGLDKIERKANLRGAFKVSQSQRHLIQNKNLLLIDDVLTTGASCHEAAKTLKRQGAKSVTIACLARTPLKSLPL